MDKNIFNDLSSLVELELSYNLLEDFPPELYANTKNLKEVSLDNNQITKLNVDPLNKLCLKRLSLDKNKGAFDVRQAKKSVFSSTFCNVASNGASTGKVSDGSSAVDVPKSEAKGLLKGADFELDCTCGLKTTTR